MEWLASGSALRASCVSRIRIPYSFQVYEDYDKLAASLAQPPSKKEASRMRMEIAKSKFDPEIFSNHGELSKHYTILNALTELSDWPGEGGACRYVLRSDKCEYSS